MSKTVNSVAYILLIIGGLNWGLVGLLNFDAVVYVSNLIGVTALASIVYVLVGLSALVVLAQKGKVC